MSRRTDTSDPHQEIPRCLRLAFANAEGGNIEKAHEYWGRAEAMGYIPTRKSLREYRKLVGELPGPGVGPSEVAHH